ncbi:hypothetical protein [Deminuibacter soli]|uniref:Uncharacterized protein n=1 Tax=Deminuibacter soli TaxID=2291815 RepID=A0A3E1NIK2_9BACT|nr:hypothetical protein [Deminuibacter soli]RFM27759.1 hypothetical protein DXN05_13745 [Deminuibacter soli]
MEDPFLLPVTYKGTQLQLEAQLQVRGYTHRFEVLVNGNAVYFETDEEGEYRAIAVNPITDHTPPDTGLLIAIAEAIKAVLA